jgi:hypothetical protein
MQEPCTFMEVYHTNVEDDFEYKYYVPPVEYEEPTQVTEEEEHLSIKYYGISLLNIDSEEKNHPDFRKRRNLIVKWIRNYKPA